MNRLALIALMTIVPLPFARTTEVLGGTGSLPASADTGRQASRATHPPATQPAKIITLDLGSGVTMKLAEIPAGKYTTRIPTTSAERSSNPREVVFARPFHIGVYEVTQGQWRAVMGSEPWKQAKTNTQPDDNCPASCISWKDAVAFCGKLAARTGKPVRLPHETEWEYACLAGGIKETNSTPFNEIAWHGGNSRVGQVSFARPVGQKKPNASGLYDMCGNVGEWALEVLHTSETIPDTHVLRGGSVFRPPGCCQPGTRCHCGPSDQGSPMTGLRVLLPPEGEK